ncbi:MAG: DNRLRE domain-containing protein [Chloroflexi bacterium]|nr:DNRLRE domain-containing protein [Chloroflexota bacterium]
MQRLNDPGSSLPIAFGQTLSGSILAPAEMDAYTFAASAGNKVIVRMAKSSGTLYPEIRIYNPSGLHLCQDWDYTTSEIATCTLTETGTYSILVGDYGGTKYGDYYFYLQRLHSPGNPTSIAFGQTLSASILTPAEMDTYTFAASASDKIFVRVSKSSGALYPEIRVYNPTGLQLCQDWDYTTSEIASCTLTANGVYSILVGDYGGTKTGDYYIYLQRLNNPGNATSIGFGQTLYGSIITPAEMDAYKVTVRLSGKAIVRMSRSSGTLYPEIRVYGPTGLQLCQDWDYTTSEIASCTLTDVGSYLILVGDYGGTKTGDYYLYLQWLNTTGNPVSISGDAGSAGVKLTYLDGTPQSVLSDALGFYSITVPSGWSGRVTPSKAGVVGFFPAFRDYAGVAFNQTAQDYTLKETATFKSVGARDGWILELAENANTGQSVNGTAPTLRLGDDAARKQYRSILSFSTGVLPDGAVITKVTLKVKRQGVTGGGDPVAMFQGFMLDMRRGTFGTAPLLASDWQANANKTFGAFTPALTGGWYTFNLTSAKAYINKLATGGGATQIRMRFKLDDNDDAVANTLSLYSGEADAASRPQLIVEYYVP